MSASHDFTFAWEHADTPDGPWAHLQVIRFHGCEELSALYRYELTSRTARASACSSSPTPTRVRRGSTVDVTGGVVKIN